MPICRSRKYQAEIEADLAAEDIEIQRLEKEHRPLAQDA
jgi:hypothetical protein